MRSKIYKSVLLSACLAVFFFFLTEVVRAEVRRPEGRAEEKELIQMAILLDTSNSMDGLINQAKSQLWKIVNELAAAKRNGESPDIEVALYEYGNNSIPSQESYIRMVLPLTGDLDSVSEKLFSLTTNGGDEYCGKVIESAVNGLKWSSSNDILKVIFIAGNEPFTQGGVDYMKSCRKAISKGIIVNTIFCGSYQEGIDTKWKDGAGLADGKYINIDQNQKIAYIEAPQDKEISRLGYELNKTYLAYGSAGFAKKERQSMQDKNAGSVSREAVVQRSMAKASPQYNNSEWDLLDAVRTNKIALDKIEKDKLPAEMKNMNSEERKEYLNNMLNKREEIQKKISRLSEERHKYIESERKKKSQDNTLDEAIIKAVRDQAAAKDYRFN